MPTPPLVAAVRRSLDSVSLLRPGVSVVVALSGGPDSVALTDALLRAARKPGIRVVAAHLDHGLRKDSREDAQFCEELCDRIKVPLRSGRGQTSAKAMSDGGLEEAARLIRYSFLRRVAREENASAILLGHTLDDQAETVLLQDRDATLAILHQLRALGIRIAMDDFGTGYSSLTYLQSFPFDRIKIDRSFVKNITENAGSLYIVRAVAALANGMGMAATAEGVETAEQLDKIAALGCTEMQGYLFSRPLPLAEIERLFVSRLQRRDRGTESAVA